MPAKDTNEQSRIEPPWFTCQGFFIPDAVDAGVHGEEIANFGALACDAAEEAWRKAGQMEAVHHVQTRHSALHTQQQRELPAEAKSSFVVNMLVTRVKSSPEVINCNKWRTSPRTRALHASESDFLPEFKGRFSAELVYLSRGLQDNSVASNEGRRDLGNSKVDRVAAGKVRKI
jgi:hypothetical protein